MNIIDKTEKSTCKLNDVPVGQVFKFPRTGEVYIKTNSKNSLRTLVICLNNGESTLLEGDFEILPVDAELHISHTHYAFAPKSFADIKPEVKPEVKSDKLEELKDKEPEPVKKRIDDGKIVALRKAGWSMNKIAEEMGITPLTVSNHLKKLDMN